MLPRTVDAGLVLLALNDVLSEDFGDVFCFLNGRCHGGVCRREGGLGAKALTNLLLRGCKNAIVTCGFTFSYRLRPIEPSHRTLEGDSRSTP